MTHAHDRPFDQVTPVRATRAPEIAFEDHIPTVPGALEDGLIPVEFLDPHLTVHAPLVKTEGYITIEGDIFEAIIDGKAVANTKTTYHESDNAYIELRIAKSQIDALEDGPHDLSYRVYPLGFGRPTQLGTGRFYLDRQPAGGRRLGRMKFSRQLEVDGLSLSTLLTLPSAVLRGEIPDYDGIDPRDTIQIFMKQAPNGVEIAAGTIDVVTDGLPMNALFDRTTLEVIPDAGGVDFYYRVVNAAGLTSDASAVTTIDLSIKGSPETLPGPVVVGSHDGLLTDADVRPDLIVHIPPLVPQALAGDTVQLTIGGIEFAPMKISEKDLVDAPLKAIEIAYETVLELANLASSNAFACTASYIHRCAGVVSHSSISENRFDISLPGGWDPRPETEASEALAPPILRGSTGSIDNEINFSDSTKPANVIINSPASATGGKSFEKGDSISAALDGEVVGAPYTHDKDVYPIVIAIPAADLNAHSGTPDLTYSVTRELVAGKHTATALSPTQRVRIDSKAALPGGGDPLHPAVFLGARTNESDFGSRILIAADFVDGFTTLRLFGYKNMAIADTIVVTYEGFDLFDGGTAVPGSAGTIHHEVSGMDLVPKLIADPVTGETVYVDLLFPLQSVRRLVHGHVAYSHRITNRAGEALSDHDEVWVSVRFA